MSPPSPFEIKAIRQEMDLSVAGLAQALDYPGGERSVRALEKGERDGKPFVMVGSAAMALRYLRGIAAAVRRRNYGVPAEDCLDDLKRLLPEELR